MLQVLILEAMLILVDICIIGLHKAYDNLD